LVGGRSRLASPGTRRSRSCLAPRPSSHFFKGQPTLPVKPPREEKRDRSFPSFSTKSSDHNERKTNNRKMEMS
jgi:hypothetical protein